MKRLRKAVAAACALAAGLAQAAGVPGQGTWETTLLPRDIDGDTVTDAFYDTALDITWLRDANVNGTMVWNDAQSWVNTLVVGGVGGWRLPTMVDTGAPGCDFSYSGGTDCGQNVDTATSEMAHLYYVTLGNKAYYDISGSGPQPGWGLTNTGGFQNLQPNGYWSGTEYAPDTFYAWTFYTSRGVQHFDGQLNQIYALAVRTGDVAAVPEPQGLVLMLAGLTLVGLVTRQRRSGASRR